MRTLHSALTLLFLTVLLGCAISPKGKEVKFLNRGQKSFDSKEFSRAAIDFKNAARQMPKHPEAYYRLGLTYIELGDAATGVAFLRKALSLDPKHVPARVKLAELMAFDNNADVVREAERMSKDAAASAKDNADAMATLALTQLRLGNEVDAETNLRRTLAAFPLHFKSSTVLAAALLSKGDWKAAERIMKDAAARDPKSALPELALARLAAMRNDSLGVEAHFRRAVQIEPGNEQALLELGTLQLRSGKKDEAGQSFAALAKAPAGKYKAALALYLFNTGQKDAGIKELETLWHRYPSERELRTQLIAAYFSTNNAGRGEEVLTEALKKNEEDVDALIQRSQLELRRGAYAQAEKDLTRALRFQPDSAQVHFLLARTHASQGNSMNEKRELNEALAHDPTLFVARAALAQALLRSGAANAAVELMDKAPTPQLHTMPWIVQRNWALIESRNLSELRKGIDEGLSKARTPDLLMQDALYAAQSKDLKRARISMEEALGKAPRNTRAIDLMVRIMNAQNDAAGALQIVKSSADSQPGSAPMQLYAGNYFVRTGHRPEARAAFARARAAEPGLVAAEFSTAQLDVVEGHLDDARRTLSSVIDKQLNTEDARVLLGMVEEQAGQYNAAVSHFQKALETQPNNVTALNNLAFRLANNLNRADEALAYAEKAKELDPHNPAIDDSIGWVFYKKGMYPSAIQYLQSAVTQQATPIREYHLAMAYAKGGSRIKSEQAFEVARRMDPNLPEALEARQLLAQSK